jgi:hypothetical protein
MELRFPHKVEYVKGVTSIDEVIANLAAQKKLIESGAIFLAGAVDGLEVLSVEIRVIEIREGSFITEFLVVLYGTYQTRVEDAVVGGIERVFGVDVPPEYETLVTLATLAVTYWVARFAYDKVRGKRPTQPASTHIAGDYNTVVNLVGTTLNLPSEKVEEALQKAVPPAKRRSLISSMANFLRPRNDGTPQAIIVPGFGEVAEETVKEVPDALALSELDESKNLDLPNVQLDIRATDRDSPKKWGAKIVGHPRFKKRLPMDIYPTVDRNDLAKHQSVRGDIVLEGETTPDGEFKARRIHLINYRPEVVRK